MEHQRCPGPDCYGQFAWLRNYGFICTGWLSERDNEELAVLAHFARANLSMPLNRNSPLSEVVRQEGAGL